MRMQRVKSTKYRRLHKVETDDGEHFAEVRVGDIIECEDSEKEWLEANGYIAIQAGRPTLEASLNPKQKASKIKKEGK